MSDAAPHAVNYHAWVFDSFAPYLRPGTALEVGSGHGVYSRMLARVVASVIVSDIDPVAVDAIRSELSDLKNVAYRVMDGVDASALRDRIDDVVLVNVLEHIERDDVLLRSAFESFSPAFPQLYSRFDRDAGHFRRYTRSGLVGLVRGAGFDILHARLFNAVGFFGWYANKLMGSSLHAKHTNAQVLLYDRLIPILKRFDSFIPFIGTSLLVVGRKP
jgi:SAM-dependent methyltransferase